VRAGELLDRFGLLPMAMIEPDPMFTTFSSRTWARSASTRASIISGARTCSAFSVIGRVKPALPAGGS
jgi:hypothetical protein